MSPSVSSLTDGADTRGTVVHALLAHYYRTGDMSLDTTKVVFTHNGEPWLVPRKERLEAEAMFRAYRVAFPPGDLGKVLGIERCYEAPDYIDLPWKPAGIRLTGQIDLNVKMSKKDAQLSQVTRNVSLEPGIYVVDHKTKGYGKPREDLAWEYRLNLQNYMYQLLYKEARGAAPKGGLINIIMGGRVPTFFTYRVPPPGEKEIAAVRNLLLLSKREIDKRESTGLADARPTHCFAFGRPCHHYVEGRCDRG